MLSDSKFTKQGIADTDQDSMFCKDSDGNTAIRVVTTQESLPAEQPDSMFTKDINGNTAVRTVGGGGGSDPHNLGWYATPEALRTAHPTADDGDWAIVGSTDTVWVWDSDTNAWKDSDQKGQVTSVNGSTGAVTITAADLGATTASTAVKTLNSANWSNNEQSVYVYGVTASNTVIVSPAPASQADYVAAGIYCSAQANESLTFTCTTTPTSNISVNVLILG